MDQHKREWKREIESQQGVVSRFGLNGTGVAQVCAQSGITVILNDISQEVLEKALMNDALLGTEKPVHILW